MDKVFLAMSVPAFELWIYARVALALMVLPGGCNSDSHSGGGGFGAIQLEVPEYSTFWGVGDVDRDGVADIGILSPSWSATQNTEPLQVFVHSGKTGLRLHAYVSMDCVNSPFQAIHAVGDVNSDGVPDFTVTGRKRSTMRELVDLVDGATGDMILRIRGRSDGFGSAIVLGPDFDGGGIRDLIVARPAEGDSVAYSVERKQPLFSMAGFPVGPYLDAPSSQGGDLVLSHHLRVSGPFVFAGSARTTPLFSTLKMESTPLRPSSSVSAFDEEWWPAAIVLCDTGGANGTAVLALIGSPSSGGSELEVLQLRLYSPFGRDVVSTPRLHLERNAGLFRIQYASSFGDLEQPAIIIEQERYGRAGRSMLVHVYELPGCKSMARLTVESSFGSPLQWIGASDAGIESRFLVASNSARMFWICSEWDQVLSLLN